MRVSGGWKQAVRWKRGVTIALLAVVSARAVSAQSVATQPSTPGLTTGPVTFFPAIELRDVGSDSNVYNDAAGPRGDFTYTVSPRIQMVLPIGGTRFSGIGTGDLVYYRIYKDQQSVNGSFTGRYEAVGGRIRPFATAGFASRRERRGFEIDARARHQLTHAAAGASVDVSAMTSLTAWVHREGNAYGSGEQYQGVSLGEQLDRNSTIVAAGARFKVTPLTSLLTTVEVQQDRFDSSPVRDADSIRFVPAVEFESVSTITGSARAGYQRFTPRAGGFAGYRGFIGSAGLSYTAFNLTRLDVDANRDVAYSYDVLQPFYLESGGQLKVTQRVIGPLDVIAVGERRLVRNQRVGGTSFDGRRERTITLGGGVALRFNDRSRLTVTYERTKRSSEPAAGREYERRQLFASLSYGL